MLNNKQYLKNKKNVDKKSININFIILCILAVLMLILSVIGIVGGAKPKTISNEPKTTQVKRLHLDTNGNYISDNILNPNRIREETTSTIIGSNRTATDSYKINLNIGEYTFQFYNNVTSGNWQIFINGVVLGTYSINYLKRVTFNITENNSNFYVYFNGKIMTNTNFALYNGNVNKDYEPYGLKYYSQENYNNYASSQYDSGYTNGINQASTNQKEELSNIYYNDNAYGLGGENGNVYASNLGQRVVSYGNWALYGGNYYLLIDQDYTTNITPYVYNGEQYNYLIFSNRDNHLTNYDPYIYMYNNDIKKIILRYMTTDANVIMIDISFDRDISGLYRFTNVNRPFNNTKVSLAKYIEAEFNVRGYSFKDSYLLNYELLVPYDFTDLYFGNTLLVTQNETNIYYQYGFDNGYSQAQKDTVENNYNGLTYSEIERNAVSNYLNENAEPINLQKIFIDTFEYPYKLVKEGLNVEFLGINLGGFLIGLFSCFLVIFIVKKVV